MTFGHEHSPQGPNNDFARIAQDDTELVALVAGGTLENVLIHHAGRDAVAAVMDQLYPGNAAIETAEAYLRELRENGQQ